LEIRYSAGSVKITSSLAQALKAWNDEDDGPTDKKVNISSITVEPKDSDKDKKTEEKTTNLTNDQIKAQIKDTSVKFIAHKVHPDDSLSALAVRYYTTEEAIRQYNRRVVFDTLDNVTGDIIQIPCHVSESDLAPPDPNKEEERRKRELVRNFVQKAVASGKGIRCHDTEAAFYLDEAEWSLDKAFKQWKEDTDWERQNPNPQISTSSETKSQETTSSNKSQSSSSDSSSSTLCCYAETESQSEALLQSSQRVSVSVSKEASAPPSYEQSKNDLELTTLK